MALATTCPSCKTSFKVNPEQLKLRKGLVRCGKCQHVFSGIQYLRYINESRKPKPAPRAQPVDPVAPETVAEDLNTAFFLPDTRFVPETSTTPGANATGEKVAKTQPGVSAETRPADPAAGTTIKQTASSPEKQPSTRVTADAPQATDHAAPVDPDTVSPDTLGADTLGPDTISPDTVSPDTVSPDSVSAAGDGKSGSSRRSRKSRRARRKNRRKARAAAAQAATQASPAQPEPTAVAVAAAAAVAGTALGTSAARQATSDNARTSDTEQTPANGLELAPGSGEAPGDTHQPADAAASADMSATTASGQNNGYDEHDTVGTSTESSPAPSSEPSAKASADATGNTPAADKPAHGDAPADNAKPRASDEPVPHAARTRPGQEDKPAAQSHWLDGLDETVDNGGKGIADEEDAIDFFGQTTRPVFDFDLPPRSVWMAAGALALLLTLQLAIGARDSLAAWFPSAKPVLESVSNRLGLQVQLPLDPDAIRIESHDLASAPASEGPGAYVLNLLIRNHADVTLRWPAIELTLTDRTGANILVRKALLPADYLADGQPAEEGMPPLSEQAVRLNLRTQNIGPMHGYTAVLFYP